MNRAPPAGQSGAPTPGVDRQSELPVLHRITVAYLMLPVVVWLLGWFHWWLGIPAAAALVAGLWRVMAGSWRMSIRPRVLGLLLVAFGWIMLTAAGGVFDGHNGDWDKHRGVLTDLARHDWPVWLPDPLAAFLLAFEGQPGPNALLRYYLGYYMVPGLIGHWIGAAALHWVVPIWTWGGVGLLVLLFTRHFTRIGALVVGVVVLVSFSGMDYLRLMLLYGEAVPLLDASHIEADDFLFFETNEFLPWRIQYSSNTSALMWAPQHFIASGLYAMLLLQLRREPRFLASSGVLLAASLFWSPFVAVGLLPFIVVLLMDNGLRPFLRWQNIVLAGPLAVLLIAFLTSGTSDIAKGWLWSKSDWEDLAPWLIVFYLTEFLLLALLLWLCQPQLGKERFFVASVATLAALPVYTYGYFNDLGMRASLPALMILCWCCAEVIENQLAILPQAIRRLPASWGRLGRWWKPTRKRAALQRTAKRPRTKTTKAEHAVGKRGGETPRALTRVVLLCPLGVVLTIGAITPLHELVRGYEDYQLGQVFPPYRHTLALSVPRPVYAQYALVDAPAALGFLLRKREQSHGGEYKRVIHSEFDVYRNGKLLIYTKAPCPEEELGPSLFLRTRPADVRDLPSNRRQFGFEHETIDRINLHTLWLGERCAFARTLPEYDVRRVATGQTRGGKRLWTGEFAEPGSH